MRILADSFLHLETIKHFLLLSPPWIFDFFHLFVGASAWVHILNTCSQCWFSIPLTSSFQAFLFPMPRQSALADIDNPAAKCKWDRLTKHQLCILSHQSFFFDCNYLLSRHKTWIRCWLVLFLLSSFGSHKHNFAFIKSFLWLHILRR